MATCHECTVPGQNVECRGCHKKTHCVKCLAISRDANDVPTVYPEIRYRSAAELFKTLYRFEVNTYKTLLGDGDARAKSVRRLWKKIRTLDKYDMAMFSEKDQAKFRKETKLRENYAEKLKLKREQNAAARAATRAAAETANPDAATGSASEEDDEEDDGAVGPPEPTLENTAADDGNVGDGGDGGSGSGGGGGSSSEDSSEEEEEEEAAVPQTPKSARSRASRTSRVSRVSRVSRTSRVSRAKAEEEK